jgi:hypothetical protein
MADKRTFYKPLTVLLDYRLHRAFKKACAESEPEVTMTDVVTTAVKSFVKNANQLSLSTAGVTRHSTEYPENTD